MKPLKKLPMPVLSLIFFALLLSIASATPMIPTVFSGKAVYSENPSMNLEGYDINVSMPGKPEWNVGKVSSGNIFEVDVDPEGASGEIYFYVGGIKALENGSYVKGGFVEINLTITSPPVQNLGYCGDSVCNNNENCSICSQDCGSCNPDSESDNSGSSGGSGGGGSSSSGSTETAYASTANSDSEPKANHQNYSGKLSPITGGAVGISNFLKLINSGYLLIVLAVLIAILGIILLILPRK